MSAPSFKYKFYVEHFKHSLEQVWEADPKHEGDFSTYELLAPYEVSQIEEFLPKKPGRIAELGAGLGRGSVFINHYYNSVQKWAPLFTLADRDGYSKENTGAFNPKEDEYYCDFEATKSFCNLNGIEPSRLSMFDTEKDDWGALPSFDFIFSFCSFGMHVDLHRYMDRILSVTKPGATLIFGTRHAGYNGASFADKFNEVIYKPSLQQAPFPIENWLILRGKK